VSDLESAITALEEGRLIVIPTDTVYGLACVPHMPDAVDSVFEAKGRPRDLALPVLAASVEDLQRVAEFDDRAISVAERFWPGGITLVLERAPSFDHDLGGDDKETVAVRVPDSREALEILRRSGPLAVTSANPSGAPASVTIEQARAALGDSVSVYIDGGRCSGVESTIVSLLERVRVVRQGAVPMDAILAALP
jgi:tRNA threonylcarbamoyl adenosine modification protein (Sua5/YciO/YrdC/YwlC family)